MAQRLALPGKKKPLDPYALLEAVIEDLGSLITSAKNAQVYHLEPDEVGHTLYAIHTHLKNFLAYVAQAKTELSQVVVAIGKLSREAQASQLQATRTLDAVEREVDRIAKSLEEAVKWEEQRKALPGAPMRALRLR